MNLHNTPPLPNSIQSEKHWLDKNKSVELDVNLNVSPTCRVTVSSSKFS